MPDMEEKLARFTSAILAEGTAEADAAKKKVDERRKEQLRQAEAEATAKADAYYQEQRAQLLADAERRRSRHSMENKKKLALRREELARMFFSDVRKWVVTLTESLDYPDLLREQLSQILGLIGERRGILLYLRPEDISIGASLQALARGRQAELLTADFALGGLVVECPERGLVFDATFDVALEELDGHFAERFYLQISMEED